MTRKQAIQELTKRQGIQGTKITYSEAYLTAIDMAVDALNSTNVKGEWYMLQTHCYTCSECNRRVYSSTCPSDNYCQRCGADMRESRDEWHGKEDKEREKAIREGRLKPWP